MVEKKTFYVNCPRCHKANVPHIVYNFSKARGYKLKCINCRHIAPRYFSEERLIELSTKQEEITK